MTEEQIIVVGDVHLHNFSRWGRQKKDGINYRAAITLNALDTAFNLHPTGTFVFNGDVFDTHKPEPALIEALMSLFKKYSEAKFYLMTGNHDVGSSGANDHSLAPFKHCSDNVVVVDEPMFMNPDILLHPWLIKGSLEQSIIGCIDDTYALAGTYPQVIVSHSHLFSTPFAIEPNADLSDVVRARIQRSDQKPIQFIAGHQHDSHKIKDVTCVGAFSATALGDSSGGIAILDKDDSGRYQQANLMHLSSAATIWAQSKETWSSLPSSVTPSLHTSNHFYVLEMNSPADIDEAKKAAKHYMASGVGGVELAIRKSKYSKEKPNIVVGHSYEGVESTIAQEIERYTKEYGISTTLHEAIVECLQNSLKSASRS